MRKNAHQQLPMASTTKIMTALLAIEHGDLDEMVTTDASAYGVEGSSMYLQLEETVSLRESTLWAHVGFRKRCCRGHCGAYRPWRGAVCQHDEPAS